MLAREVRWRHWGHTALSAIAESAVRHECPQEKQRCCCFRCGYCCCCYGLIVFFSSLSSFVLAFVCLLTLFYFLPWGVQQGWEAYGRPGGEQNWGYDVKSPRDSIKKLKKAILRPAHWVMECTL